MQNKIWKILKQVNDEIPQNYDINLLENSLIDSFDIVNLVADLEEKFLIEIDPEDIIPENFSTINDIACLMEKYLNI